MSNLDRLAAEVAALRRRVAELETRERVRAVPASGGTFTGAITMPSGTQIGTGVGDTQLLFSGGAGASRDLIFRSGTLNRWLFRVSGETESGSDAGSNLLISSWPDSGSGITERLRIVRATGYLIVQQRIYAPGLRTAPATPDAGELFVDASGFVKRG